MPKLSPGLESLIKPRQISKPLVFVSIGSGDTHELVCVDVFCQMYGINYRFIAIDIDRQKIIKCTERLLNLTQRVIRLNFIVAMQQI